MKLEDIIALAKQGYKPNDIKELIELSKETETVNSEQENTPEDGGESDHTTQTENPTDESKVEETIDYKKLYEEEHSKLLNAQKNNTTQNMADNVKSDEDVVLEFFKNYK